jgi:hypothetical protein
VIARTRRKCGFLFWQFGHKRGDIMPKLKTETKLEIIKNDFSLWAKNFIKIVDNNGDEVPFILNDQQTKII